MASFIERQADNLASRSNRRGFLGLAGKVTAAVAGLGFGLSRSYNAAAAYSYRCCTLVFSLCSTCPNCPQGTYDIYGWSCCYNGCLWTCQECYYDSSYERGCSCGDNNYRGCNGRVCNYAAAEANGAAG